MRFQVSQELQQPVGTSTGCELQQRSVSLGHDALLTDLVGTMDLLRTDKGLLVSVNATCAIRDRCSRCLVDISYPLRLQFQEEYLATVDVATGLPLPIPGGIDNFLIDTDYVLDLGEALRQYKLVSEPLKPLCAPDCSGLCPRCGHNLNEGPCRCPAETDARWGALTKLASSLDQDERS